MSVWEVAVNLVLMDTYITRMWIGHLMRLLLTKYDSIALIIIIVP
jgi:hypothetical protein